MGNIYGLKFALKLVLVIVLSFAIVFQVIPAFESAFADDGDTYGGAYENIANEGDDIVDPGDGVNDQESGDGCEDSDGEAETGGGESGDKSESGSESGDNGEAGADGFLGIAQMSIDLGCECENCVECECDEVCDCECCKDPECAHTADEPVVTLSPTCKAQGTETTYCKDCGHVIRTKVIGVDPGAHTAGKPVVTISPTCKATGKETTYCKDCGYVMEIKYIEADPDAHMPGKQKTIIAPTCMTKGAWEIKCIFCDEVTSSGDIDALGHSAGLKTETVAPTETSPGRWEIRCIVCGELLDSGAVYKAPEQDEPFNGTGNITIRIDVPFEKFMHLTLNGEIVPKENYDAYAGSTIIVFKEAFLNTLPIGDIPIVAHFTDGIAAINLVIESTTETVGSMSTYAETGGNSAGGSEVKTAEKTDTDTKIIDDETECQTGLEPLGLAIEDSAAKEDMDDGAAVSAAYAKFEIWIIVTTVIIICGMIVWIRHRPNLDKTME